MLWLQRLGNSAAEEPPYRAASSGDESEDNDSVLDDWQPQVSTSQHTAVLQELWESGSTGHRPQPAAPSISAQLLVLFCEKESDTGGVLRCEPHSTVLLSNLCGVAVRLRRPVAVSYCRGPLWQV